MQLEEINSKQGVAKSSVESIFVMSVVEKDRIKWNFIYMYYMNLKSTKLYQCRKTNRV